MVIMDELDFSIPYNEELFSTVGNHWIKSISQKVFYLIKVRLVNGSYLYSQLAFLRISSTNPNYYEVHHTITNRSSGESINILYSLDRSEYTLDKARELVSEYESFYSSITSIARALVSMNGRRGFSIENIEYPPLKLIFNNTNTINTSSVVRSSKEGYYSFSNMDNSRIYLFSSDDDSPIISENYKDELNPIGYIDINNDQILLNISMNPVYITITGSLSSLGVDEIILLYDQFINCNNYNKMLNLVTSNEFMILDIISDISVGWHDNDGL